MPFPVRHRTKVLWFGPRPSVAIQQQFEERELTVEYHELLDDIEAALPYSRAVVFHDFAAKRSAIPECLSRLAINAVDHGLLICALACDDESRNNLIRVLNSLTVRVRGRPHSVPHIIRTANVAAYEIPEQIGRWQSEKSCGVAVDITGVAIEPEAELLLKRAFSDCTLLRLEDLREGHSASVFSVYATFADTAFVSRPLPFFAKIDYRYKIEEELRRYENLVAPAVPFNLRPNIERERCVTGHTKAIIVGSFVERSESLWDAVRRGTAQPVLYNLFDETLRGWRLQAYEVAGGLRETTNVANELQWALDACRISSGRWAKCLEAGATEPPERLIQMLRDLPATRHRVAPLHGDLHSRNVRVRGNDAILIDFYSTRELGPIMADPASLEVSLSFAVNENDARTSWRELIDRLYLPEYFLRPPEPALDPQPREWLWNSVRQIRLMSIGAEESAREYQTAVAIYLLRHACFEPPAETDEVRWRRAYAYVVAQRLINNLRVHFGQT